MARKGVKTTGLEQNGGCCTFASSCYGEIFPLSSSYTREYLTEWPRREGVSACREGWHGQSG